MTLSTIALGTVALRAGALATRTFTARAIALDALTLRALGPRRTRFLALATRLAPLLTFAPGLGIRPRTILAHHLRSLRRAGFAPAVGGRKRHADELLDGPQVGALLAVTERDGDAFAPRAGRAADAVT